MKNHIYLFGLSLALSAAFASASQAQVRLSWQDNSANETGFTVERATSASGPWTYCGQTGANTTSFVDNYAAGGVTYYYRVKAQNATWTSNYTNVASKSVASVPASNGTGLKGQYFSDTNLSSLIRTQTDPQVNFNWGTGSPGTSIGADNFSVRWSGQVQTQEGGTYVFQSETDDGVRVWVNNALVIDKWTTLGTFAANVTLAANTKVSIKVEYRELTGAAFARLLWKRPGAGNAVLVPKSQLFPA